MPDTRRIRLTAALILGLFLVFCLALPALVSFVCGPYDPLSTVIAGGILSCVAIPFHLLGDRKRAGAHRTRPVLFCIAMMLNTLGTACSEAAYYIHIQAPSPSSSLIAGMLIPLGLALLLWLSVTILPARYAGLTLGGALLTGAGLIGSLVMWIRHGKTPDAVFWNFLFFTLLGLLAVIIALYAACEDDTRPNQPAKVALRYLSLASFGLLLLVFAIVLLILLCAGGDCDCDCGDGCCDCGDCGCPDKPNRKAKHTK